MMMTIFKRSLTTTFWCVVAVCLSTCGVKPDNPGSCSLKCGNAVIGAGDYTIEKLTPDVNYRCPAASAGTVIKQETTIQFRIKKQVGLGSGDTMTTTVPNVSVEPQVIGLVDTTIGSGAYLGVKTPTTDFCSDSCGVVSVTVVGICPSAQSSEITVGIRSGALSTESPAKITFQSETDEDEEETDSSDSSDSSDDSSDNSTGLTD